MTVLEAAARLGITYDFCLRNIRMGKLKAVKKGREWVVDPNSVKRRLIQVADHRARSHGRANGKGE